MTITMFISMLTAGSFVSSVLTEAIKQAYKNANKACPPNIVALINSIVVGGGGTAAAYMLMGIDWSVNNIICLAGTVLSVWVMCMVGFDKFIQSINQVTGIVGTMNPKQENKED